ncbi:iron-sulfur cluster biosynthesis family protein [Gottfriedia sp. NPDC056225]|uniref:iron-sulfur cluster biosynthesis family protein n=1 Tax=Gottfriedia sp. NPDC056225 TaxID=3345751 RepID=UPI001558520E|nr:iron-sulfur cluster biosynthesis family protein [Arthrobacter citreus]
MDFKITDEAKEILAGVDQNKILQLEFDRGSCDVVNNIYEIKVINKRECGPNEKMIIGDGFEFMVNKNFEDVYEDQLVIDYKDGSFIFKNRNQIFNNRIGLTYIK